MNKYEQIALKNKARVIENLKVSLSNQEHTIEQLKAENNTMRSEMLKVTNELADKEVAFIKLYKENYFEYKDMIDNFGFTDEYTKRCGRVVDTLQNVAKNVFGWNDTKIDETEDNFNKEWRNKNEWKYR